MTIQCGGLRRDIKEENSVSKMQAIIWDEWVLSFQAGEIEIQILIIGVGVLPKMNYAKCQVTTKRAVRLDKSL
jgi:hypothetical protein